MTRKARYTALLLALLMLVTVACGSGGTASQSSGAAEPSADGGEAAAEEAPPADVPEIDSIEVEGEITIEWWHALENQYDDLISRVVAEFNETHPLVTVEAVYQGSYSDINEKLVAAHAAGNTPALSVANTPYVAEYGALGLAEVLTPYIEADNWDIGDFGDGLIVSSSYNGQPISLPFLISTQVLYYNKDLVDANGVALPETWNDMDAFVKDNTTDDYKALAVPAWDYWYYETFFLNAGLEIIKDDYTTDIASDKALEISQAFYDWYRDGYVDWCYGTDASTNMRQGFIDGKYLAVGHTSSLYEMYVENCDFEVGMAYYPGNTTRKSEIGGCVLLIPAKNDQDTKNAAWEFLKFLTGKEVNMLWADETGYMPTRKSVLDTQEGLDFLEKKPAFQVIFDNLDNINPRIQIASYDTMAGRWRDELSKAIIEQGDLESLLQGAANMIDEMLEDIQ